MNEKLRLTLNKIEALANQNQEFATELQKIVKGLSFADSTLCNNDKITRIEHYLGLDYELDSYHPEIDYSKIDNDYVRSQLICDYREMLRYRYGVRSHKVDFSEFCKYAHFQAEMLFNYYFQLKYSDFASFKTDIKAMLTKTKINDNISTIEGVSYTSKMIFFKKIENFYKDNNILEYICWARNSASHRTTKTKQELEDNHYDYLNALKNSGLPLNSTDDDFDWDEIGNDHIKKNIHETQYKNKSPFKENAKAYKFDKFMFKQQFNKVVETLSDLCNIVVKVQQSIL